MTLVHVTSHQIEILVSFAFSCPCIIGINFSPVALEVVLEVLPPARVPSRGIETRRRSCRPTCCDCMASCKAGPKHQALIRARGSTPIPWQLQLYQGSHSTNAPPDPKIHLSAWEIHIDRPVLETRRMGLARCLQIGRGLQHSTWVGSVLTLPSGLVQKQPQNLHVCRGLKTREGQLQSVAAENRKEVAEILDQAEQAARSWDVQYTHFYTPPVVQDALSAIEQLGDVTAIGWGGYPQAERCRIALGREEVMLAAKQDPSQLSDAVAALDCRGNFMFDPATHRDFLGAILGTGVVRDRVGDILIQGEGGAQILVEPDLVEHFEASLTKVRTVPLETRVVPLNQLRVAPPKTDQLNSIEASLRLDAVGSAGFRISRSKMSDLIKGGDVKLNWRPVSKASVEVKEGDVVSCAGKGRLEVRSVSTTKKGKFAVSMVRFV